MGDLHQDLLAARRQAARLAADEWQAYTINEAAKAAGKWLEARGRLDQPIRTFTMRDLEQLSDAAITRWIVLASHRLAERPDASDDLSWLLAG